MIYMLEIKLFNNDEFESDRKTLAPIFSKDLSRLKSIKKQLEEYFAKKNHRNINQLSINIREVIPSKEIKRDEIDELKKEINSFFYLGFN